MAWDVAGTKRRIYEAALAEFAEQGPNATTIDRIAKRAQINRERIYKYFGDKATLFATVVRGEVDKIAEAVPLTINSAADAGAFAGKTFDYQLDHPALARLVLWEGLTVPGHVPDETERSAVYRAKTRAVAAAQQAGLIDDRVSAPDLVFLLISLSSYWSAAPHIARMLAGADEHTTADPARRRAAVVHAATQLATPCRSGAS